MGGSFADRKNKRHKCQLDPQHASGRFYTRNHVTVHNLSPTGDQGHDARELALVDVAAGKRCEALQTVGRH
jgi:hypothetical protein